MSKMDVKREIVDPMLAIWAKPRGVKNEDIALGFYLDDLAEFDGPTLALAFQRVRLEYEYQSWPSTATFRKACVGSRGGVIESDRDDSTAKAVRLNNLAAEYANMRFASAEGLEAIKGFYAKQWREYIKREAVKQLYNGWSEPDVQVSRETMAEFEAQGHRAASFKLDCGISR